MEHKPLHSLCATYAQSSGGGQLLDQTDAIVEEVVDGGPSGPACRPPGLRFGVSTFTLMTRIPRESFGNMLAVATAL